MVYNLIKLNAVDLISLKLPRVGGIHKAMKIIEICELAGMDVKFDWVHYGRIGDTAVCHVAANLRFSHIVAVDAHTQFKEDIVSSGGMRIEEGKAQIPSLPGLGIEIDDTVLDRCKIE